MPVVYRSTFPSDFVLSTHLAWQPGVARLASWALAEALLATGAPALTTRHFDLASFPIDSTFAEAEGARPSGAAA